MKVRIALAGELPVDLQLQKEIGLLVEQIKDYLCKGMKEAELQMLVSPSYTGEEWLIWSEKQDFSLCTYNFHKDSGYQEQCAQVVKKETSLRNLLGESICDKADILVVSWSEDMLELAGATWELMKLAYDRKLPCVWVSTKTQKMYCLWDSYYKEYSPAYMEAVMVPLKQEEMRPSVSETEKEKFLAFWQRRRARFMNKFKANTAVHPVQGDVLLKEDFKPVEVEKNGENTRKLLLDKFKSYDAAAINSNSMFQAMVYQRSVLPFIATIFIAVGFYVETLFGTTLSVMVPQLETVATISALVIAGLGFLIHGALNLYTYRLSQNRQVQKWQKDYANNRYIAEMLRLLIHFVPYGVSLNVQKLCGQNKELCAQIKHLADDIEPEQVSLDREKVQHILRHTKEMLDDQIAYHETSVNRYEKIVDFLDKWGKRITYVGLFLVIGRGALQFGLVILKTMQEVQGIELINSTIISISRSFLNMLALVLPALAGYFLTKSQQNNFRYNLNNHQRMIFALDVVRKKVATAMVQEEIPLEVINITIMELAETMLLQDSLEWHHQYMNSSIKPL